MVAPLAFLPMAVLVLIMVLPFFLKTKALPKQFQPLYIFFLLAIFSTSLAYMRDLPTFRAIPIWRNAVEGLVTLLFGFGFYLVTVLSVDSEDKLRSALRWIDLGGAVIILAVGVQYLTYKILGSYPQFLNSVQSLFSTASRLYDARATGLAFEPSWLAHQLNIMYIPLWLGFTVRNESVFKRRLFGKISIECLLLIGGTVSMFLSFSRIGWLSAILVFMYLVFRLANYGIEKVILRQEKKNGRKRTKKQRLGSKILLWVLLFVILLGLVFAAGLTMRALDPRMEQLFDLTILQQHGIMGWASRLSFAERITYWQTAFNVYIEHPIFGSGLGVAGYYYPETVPSFGYQLPETLSVMLYDSFIPNAKNLWVRLLAETGIVGFSVFVSWVVMHWRSAKRIESSKKSHLLKAMGLAGQLLIVALIVEGFSVDTFGLPYYWVGLGLIAASSRFTALRSGSTEQKKSE